MTVIPSIRNILVILEPVTFPATISGEPSNTAIIEEASSGNDVPAATRLMPIIKGDMPRERPIFSAESTNEEELFIKTIRLAINTIIHIIILLISYFLKIIINYSFARFKKNYNFLHS